MDRATLDPVTFEHENRNKEAKTEVDEAIEMRLAQVPNARWSFSGYTPPKTRRVKNNIRFIKAWTTSSGLKAEDGTRSTFTIPVPTDLGSYMAMMKAPEDSIWHVHSLITCNFPTTIEQNKIYNAAIEKYHERVESRGTPDIWDYQSSYQRRRKMIQRLLQDKEITPEEASHLKSGRAFMKDKQIVMKSAALGTAITLSMSGVAQAKSEIWNEYDFMGDRISHLVIVVVLSLMAVLFFNYVKNKKKVVFGPWTIPFVLSLIYTPIIGLACYFIDFDQVYCSCMIYGYLTAKLFDALDQRLVSKYKNGRNVIILDEECPKDK